MTAIDDVSALTMDPRLRGIPKDFAASTVTLDDVFPSTTDLDLTGSEHPFAVAVRRHVDGKLFDPDLLVVTSNGELHRYLPSADRKGGWSEEPQALDVPALKGAKVR